jgi:hypothetical protein
MGGASQPSHIDKQCSDDKRDVMTPNQHSTLHVDHPVTTLSEVYPSSSDKVKKQHALTKISGERRGNCPRRVFGQ